MRGSIPAPTIPNTKIAKATATMKLDGAHSPPSRPQLLSFTSGRRHDAPYFENVSKITCEGRKCQQRRKRQRQSGNAHNAVSNSPSLDAVPGWGLASDRERRQQAQQSVQSRCASSCSTGRVVGHSAEGHRHHSKRAVTKGRDAASALEDASQSDSALSCRHCGDSA